MFQPHWCFSPLLAGCYSIGEWSQNGLWEPSLCPQGVYIHGQSRGRGCWTSELPAVQACREQTQKPKQLKWCFCLAPHGAPSPFTLFELHHLPPGTQWSPWTATLGSGTVCKGSVQHEKECVRWDSNPPWAQRAQSYSCTLGLLKSQSTSASTLWKTLSA